MLKVMGRDIPVPGLGHGDHETAEDAAEVAEAAAYYGMAVDFVRELCAMGRDGVPAPTEQAEAATC